MSHVVLLGSWVGRVHASRFDELCVSVSVDLPHHHQYTCGYVSELGNDGPTSKWKVGIEGTIGALDVKFEHVCVNFWLDLLGVSNAVVYVC